MRDSAVCFLERDFKIIHFLGQVSKIWEKNHAWIISVSRTPISFFRPCNFFMAANCCQRSKLHETGKALVLVLPKKAFAKNHWAENVTPVFFVKYICFILYGMDGYSWLLFYQQLKDMLQNQNFCGHVSVMLDEFYFSNQVLQTLQPRSSSNLRRCY